MTWRSLEYVNLLARGAGQSRSCAAAEWVGVTSVEFVERTTCEMRWRIVEFVSLCVFKLKVFTVLRMCS